MKKDRLKIKTCIFSSSCFVTFALNFILLGLPIAGSLTLVSACGTANVFDPLAKRNKKEEARREIENKNYDDAIVHLQAWLSANPNDNEARAMLSVALGRKGGLDPLKMAATLAQGASGDKSFIEMLAQSLPSAGSTQLTALGQSIVSLQSIPAAERTPEQSMQLALAQVTFAAAVAKSTMGDDGKIDDSKVDSLSDEQLTLAAQSLIQAPESLRQAGNGGAQQSDQVGNVATQVQSQPGSTDAERLRAFLKSQ